MIISIDFDGTLCSRAFPDIGEPNREMIEYVKHMKANGAKIILNTCRVSARLEEALEWCRQQGIEFDAVNDNLPELIERWGTNPRKISADIYIDDLAFWPYGVKRI